MNTRFEPRFRFGSRLWAMLALALGLAAGLPTATAAQAIEGRRFVANDTSREALEALLAQLEQTQFDETVDQQSRLAAANQATLIRDRLQNGDFQAGDQVALFVREDEALTDTFSVERGQLLPLPYMDPVPLRGVLRTELEPHLTGYISEIIRDPTVRAIALTRISILGQVQRPGFVLIDSDAALAEAITLAGGVTSAAVMNELVIERGGTNLWQAEGFTAGSLEDQTIDQLGLQTGDRVVVPGQAPPGQGRGFVEWMLITLPPLTAIAALLMR